MSTPSDDPLISRYLDQPPGVRRLLQVVSVFYRPMAQTSINQALGQLGWDDTPLDPTLRKRLLDEGMLQASGNYYACAPAIVELASRELVKAGRFAAVEQVTAPLAKKAKRLSEREAKTLGRRLQLRTALYNGRFGELFQSLEANDRWDRLTPEATEPLYRILTSPLDRDWLATLPPEVRHQGLEPMLDEGAWALADHQQDWELYQELLGERPHPAVTRTLVEQFLWRGQLAEAEALAPKGAAKEDLPLTLWIAFLRGDYKEALSLGETLLGLLNKGRRKKVGIPALPGLFHCLCLIRQGEGAGYNAALEQLTTLAKSADGHLDSTYRELHEMVELLTHRVDPEDLLYLDSRLYDDAPYPVLFFCLILRWLGRKPAKALLGLLERHHQTAAAHGYRWYARESGLLLGQADDPAFEQPPLLHLLKPDPPWRRALRALHSLAETKDQGKPAEQETGGHDLRMSWRLTIAYGDCTLEPREQKRSKKGWTAGRPVSLERLAKHPDEFSYLSAHDRRICGAIKAHTTYEHYGTYPRTSYTLSGARALSLAEDHPRLVWSDDPNQPVEVVRGEPVVEVKRTAKGLKLAINPYPREGTTLSREGASVRMVVCNAQHKRIGEILGHGGLELPREAEAELRAGIAAIAPLVTIHSDVGAANTDAAETEADASPVVQLSPRGVGLTVELWVRPLGDQGPQFHPGEGHQNVLTEIKGQPVQCHRRPERELQRAQSLLEACQELDPGLGWQWQLEDPQRALATLECLQAMDGVKVEWPKDKRWRLQTLHDPKGFHLEIRKQRDWFALDGELRLDEDRVVSLSELLNLLDQSPGRFIRLGEEEFIGLTSELRRRLALLADLGRGGRLHPLTAPLVEELSDGMGLKVAKAWRERLARLRHAETLAPPPPATLQAELRDYQLEGYHWLTRLAHWGAGACLADDMGLGKTLQALALILTRAADGPTLVLAPTSVCGNWLAEATRFAPALRLHRFGPGDRQAMLEGLGPHDLVVCSYGLLQSEEERLAAVPWHTLVADEAQALKNRLTKRSRAARQLQAEFRLITTGTPIENHLGELWTLFEFINPGLLGTQKQFDERFARPIEQQQDAGARRRLRQRLRPFILRRLKSDVLTELPARTEITHQVELDDEEIALYEALRRQALERMANADLAPGERRIKLLGEIMRLRRACCHPRLVLPEAQMEGAKLRAFSEIQRELRANGHRALVFSQFVDHLSILRQHLDGEGIGYQYLDGSTPAKARQAAVEAFQAGEGELFLISLRAGGTGLNLTAADYVIHMDPWWNPAVEDQATDRAHRIGQQRPVTVYRLVTAHTIFGRGLSLRRPGNSGDGRRGSSSPRR